MSNKEAKILMALFAALCLISLGLVFAVGRGEASRMAAYRQQNWENFHHDTLRKT